MKILSQHSLAGIRCILSHFSPARRVFPLTTPCPSSAAERLPAAKQRLGMRMSVAQGKCSEADPELRAAGPPPQVTKLAAWRPWAASTWRSPRRPRGPACAYSPGFHRPAAPSFQELSGSWKAASRILCGWPQAAAQSRGAGDKTYRWEKMHVLPGVLWVAKAF